MRFARPFIRAVGMALALAVAYSNCARAADAAPPSTDKAEDAPPQPPLSPELDAKFKEFMDKAKVEKVRLWNLQMKKKIEQVVKDTGLGDDGVKSLEEPTKHAVDISVDDWAAKSNETMRKELALMPPDQAVSMLDQGMAQITAFAGADWSGNVTLPFDQDDWIKALHQTLNPTQSAAWDKAEADRKEAFEKEIGDVLKNGVDRIRTQQTQDILSECKEIELAAGLPQDRSDKLETLAKKVVDQTTEMWRKRVENALLSMEEEQRHQFTSNGNIFIGPDDSENPRQQAAWKADMEGLLTADEMKRLHDERDNRRMKLAHVMGQLMLMQLDEKIAFTEAERQKLEPITDRLAKNMAPPLQNPGGNIYFGYAPGIFLAGAAKATDEELKPILDDIQLKRWRNLSTQEKPASDASDDDKSKPDENSEPEDVEKAISAFLYEKAEQERKRSGDANLLKAEDVARVAGLSPDVAARLQAAAKGATEEYLTTWRWFTEQQIRAQMQQETTAQNVKQRLKSLEDYFFQRNFGQSNRPGVWEEAMKVELNPAQQASWQKEMDARADFREKAITSQVMVGFDRIDQLTPDQWDKLEPIITKIVHDDSAAIGTVFSPFNPVPWYLEGAYALMPFAGVSDADLKAILSKDQLDRWHASPECTTASSLWQNIQQRLNQGQGAAQGGGVRVRVINR